MNGARRGALTVVGTGIRAVAQTSPEALAAITGAERVFTNLGDAVAHAWIAGLNPRVQSLLDLYAPGKARRDTYHEMAARIAACAIGGERVCFVTTGHPGAFSYPAHRAIRLARAAGISATMLPGISAEDCLFADLGVDPGAGVSSYEATAFLTRRPPLDRTCALVLWQIGAIGEVSCKREAQAWNPAGVTLLARTLAAIYGAAHNVIVYEAARYGFLAPRITQTALDALEPAMITVLSTLYVPAAAERPVDPVMAQLVTATRDASLFAADELLERVER